MKLLITSTSDIGMSGFRQAVIEGNSVRGYLMENNYYDILKLLYYPEISLYSVDQQLSNNIAPNFIQDIYNENTTTIRLRGTIKGNKFKIDLLLQEIED